MLEDELSRLTLTKQNLYDTKRNSDAFLTAGQDKDDKKV